MNTFNRCILLLGLIGGCWLGGCGGDVNYEDFKAANPDVRIRAIVVAGESQDAAAVPYLVECLEAKESGVRFWAFGALKKITNGRTMGWHYTKTHKERKACVERWRKWIRAGRPEGNGEGNREQATGNRDGNGEGDSPEGTKGFSRGRKPPEILPNEHKPRRGKR